ncbi:hypothetical protein AAVH_26523 [Aphelenchoides avenae]|nr:hypothetical protein AAVH_26523 [Aphelenchus avenae]
MTAIRIERFNHVWSVNDPMLPRARGGLRDWSQYELAARAKLSNDSGMLLLRILVNVTDVNDHPPHIPFCGLRPILASPNMSAGAKLWAFAVTDADSWVNGFSATVSGPDARYFRLSQRPESAAPGSAWKSAFDLEIAEPLTRQDQFDYNVTVIVKDHGNLTASCEVRIITFDTRSRFTSCPDFQRVHGVRLFL